MGVWDAGDLHERAGQPSDEELMERARRDADAFGELYQRYSTEIRRFIQHRVGQDSDRADDLTSQVFAKAFRAVPSFRAISFRGWLYEIARNTITDDHRRHRVLLPIEHAMTMESGDRSLEEHAVTEDTRANLLAALDRLNPTGRQIMTYRLLGLSTPEIAIRMNMSTEAVKSAQYRAFGKLRRMLASTADNAARKR